MGTVINSKGVVTTPGSGLTVQGAATITGAVTLSGSMQSSVTAITSHTTSSVGGVYTISSSTAATVAVTLPDPSTVPGSMFIYRNLSADAHTLSSSQVTADTFTICSSASNGSRVALTAGIGCSVSMVSDGANYIVIGQSGSLTISRPSA